MKQIFPILVSMLLSIMVVGCSENSQDYHSNFLITIENDTIFDVRVDNNRVFFIKTDSTSNSVEPMGYIRDCYNTNSTSNSDGPIGYIKNYYNIENQGSTNIVIPKRVRYGETMFTVINRKDFEESNAMVVVANSMKKRFDNLGNAIIHVPTNTLVAGCANTIIPHTVTKIGNWAFYLCKSLNYIEIPNSVIEIGEEAFEECSGLKTVNIPYSVEKLGSHAFATCRNMENIEIPNSVKEIGAAAFAHCDNLKSITIPNSVEKIGGWCFYNCTNLKSVTILGSTKEIGDWCFNGCYNLESITLPNSVEKIGSSAFSGCENLEQINIPNSVNEIDSWAFNGCSKLKSLYFPETLIKIDSFAFKGCDDLETIFIPNAELYNLLASNQDIFFEQGSLGTKVQLETFTEYDSEYDEHIENEDIEQFPNNALSFSVNGVSFEMIIVEEGTFTMGATAEQGGDADDDERPAHIVNLDAFFIGKYEVTQALWKAVMGNNPSYFKGDELPVEQVSWLDCQEFISQLNLSCADQLNGKRFCLPTEAQWEYAARGGNKAQGYKYSGSNVVGEVAWLKDNSGSKTHIVGTKSPNEIGLYDMSGNVYEWCNDWYGYYDSETQTNPSGSYSDSCRISRGGSWRYNAKYCRTSFRSNQAPDLRCNRIGLRLALYK